MITEFDMETGHRCVLGRDGWELYYNNSFIRDLDKFEEHKINGAIQECKLKHLEEQNELLKKYLSVLEPNKPSANIQNTSLIAHLAEIAVFDCRQMMIMEYTNFESTLYRRFAELVISECVEAIPYGYGWPTQTSFKEYIEKHMLDHFGIISEE